MMRTSTIQWNEAEELPISKHRKITVRVVTIEDLFNTKYLRSIITLLSIPRIGYLLVLVFVEDVMPPR